MATPVTLPKLGNSVETSLIASWKKAQGDRVSVGDVLCDIETDKATIDVESPAAGTLLDVFFQAGDEVPVMTVIAAIGEPGESVEQWRPGTSTQKPAPQAEPANRTSQATELPEQVAENESIAISPRARTLAAKKGLATDGLIGSGPGGRIIERDIEAALKNRPKVTPLAKSMVASGDYLIPPGTTERITSKHLVATAPAEDTQNEDITIPLKGTRKLIAQRMLNSIQTTAQLTLNASADARALLAYRARLKASDPALGLQDVTINDLILFVTARTLLAFPGLNATFGEERITQHKAVQLSFAVDTERGLIVPVIRQASALSLKSLAQESRRLATACQNGTVQPDDLTGGTFTVTNLGSLGIESFTPILNPPQVAILGVGSVNLKPIEVDGQVQFIPHVGLSLTINHQVVDGAPGARFLQAFSRNLANLDLLLAL